MNVCTNCKNEVKAVDTLGVFPFHTRGSRIRWVVVFGLLIIVWSALILVLIPKVYQSIALLTYYPLAFYLLHKVYKSKQKSIIYQCENCNNKFKGKNREKFSYAGKL